MNSNPSLGGKVPDAGVGVGAVVERVIGWPPEGRILVIGPEEAARGLSPEGDATGAVEVPAEDDRGDRGAGEGAANRVRIGTDRRGRCRIARSNFGV